MANDGWANLLNAVEYRKNEPLRELQRQILASKMLESQDALARNKAERDYRSSLNNPITSVIPDEGVNQSLASSSEGLSKFGVQLDPALQGQATTTQNRFLSEDEKLAKMERYYALNGDFDKAKELNSYRKQENERMGFHQIFLQAYQMAGMDGDKAKEILISKFGEGAKAQLDNLEFTPNGVVQRKEGILTTWDGKTHNLPNQSENKLVQGSLTEKGYSVGYNPTSNQWTANVNGANEPYNESRHGKIKQARQPITVLGSNYTFQPGTLDYMAEIYESTGQVPSFGMGSAGMKARAEFFNKIAQRAKDRGDTGAAQVARAAETKANTSALQDLTKREQLIESFNVRINATSDKVLIPLIKKYDLQNPRFINLPMNQLNRVMGSGDLAALKLSLNSISQEIAKVEFNALGIAQITDSAAKFMKDIHDENLPVGELIKVIDVGKQLGSTAIGAIGQQRADLRERMKQNTAKPNKKEQQKNNTKQTITLKSGKVIEVEE